MMVSLVNFKIVTDDDDGGGLLHRAGGGGVAGPFGVPPPLGESRHATGAAAVFRRPPAHNQQVQDHMGPTMGTLPESSAIVVEGTPPSDKQHNYKQCDGKSTTITFDSYQPYNATDAPQTVKPCQQQQQLTQAAAVINSSSRDDADSEQSCSLCEPNAGGAKENFVVTWRNLKYCIEPKWHQKLSAASPLESLANCIVTPTMKTRSQLGAADQQTHCGGKIVLDQLDGSFRSGELTAILGPSGKSSTLLFILLIFSRRRLGGDLLMLRAAGGTQKGPQKVLC